MKTVQEIMNEEELSAKKNALRLMTGKPVKMYSAGGWRTIT